MKLESYFSKLKAIVTHKVPVKDFLVQFMKSISHKRNLIRDKDLRATTRVRVAPLPSQLERDFDLLLTNFAF